MKKITRLPIVFVLILSGCAQFKTRDQVKQQNQSPVRVIVPMNEDATTSGVNRTSAPIESATRVALVLGPGGYRSLAMAQVIKVLGQKKIPIEKVVALEWSALSAAFFAADGKPHESEWRIYKLDNKQLQKKSFLNLKNNNLSTRDLREYLKENLGGRDISSFKIKFTCPQLYLKSGVVVWPEKGLAADIVENCLAYPSEWQPARGVVAAALSTAEAIDRLKREGYNVIILVNILPDGELLPGFSGNESFAAEILWEEARRNLWAAKSKATDVIEIKSKGGLFDLSQRKSLATEVEKVVSPTADRIASKYGF